MLTTDQEEHYRLRTVTATRKAAVARGLIRLLDEFDPTTLNARELLQLAQSFEESGRRLRQRAATARDAPMSLRNVRET